MRVSMPLTWSILWLLLAAPTLVADEVSLAPSRDNTLIESGLGELSNGAGQHLFAGRTGQGEGVDRRRGLVAFDLAAIAPGSTITAVSLTLHLSNSGAGAVPVSLHRVVADWGEGASDATGGEGAGAPATSGDATWIHRFFDDAFWAIAGGQFAAEASAVTVVDGNGFYSWSSSQMVMDVQAWLDDPSMNFGWLLQGDESASGTAKRFDSRENPIVDDRPRLQVQCAPATCPSDVNGDGTTDVLDLIEMILAWKTGDAGFDLDGDGAIDLDDLDLMMVNWGPC